jgi:diacylglycerol kinase family enzyme
LKIFFLLNPSDPRRLASHQKLATQIARRHGWDHRFGAVDRQHPDTTEHLIRQMIEDGCSRLVVLGGDGTLHRVLNELQRLNRLSSMEIAVVPGGTCNDFARTLRLRRKRPAAAFELACTGKTRAMDLAWANHQLFFNNAGFGRQLDLPPASAGNEPKKRPRALKTLRSFCPISLRARWDQGTVMGTFFMALVCNNPFFSGGLYFSKAIRANDGLLDVFLLPAMPKWKLVSLLLKGRLGRPVSTRQMVSLRVREIEFEAQNDLWPQEDGEPCRGSVRRIRYAIASEKAMIVVPAKSKSICF